MNFVSNFFIFIFTLVPIFLITGPALPDITITFSGLFFLFLFIFIKKNYFFLGENFFKISIFFWISIIFVSFFAYDKPQSFQDSLIFLRLLIMPTICYFLYFNNQKKIENVIKVIFFCVIFVIFDTLYQYLNYSSEFGFGEDLLGFKTDWYGRLTGPFGDELIPGAYLSKFSLLGYLFFFFVKKIKYKTTIEVLYLSLVGLVCFASGERMAFATYFLALFFLFVFLNTKRIIMLYSIILSLIFIAISIYFHPFYNDFNVISSSQYHQGLVVEKSYECEENVSGYCNKIINLQPSFIEVIRNFNTSAYGEIYNVGLNMFKNNPFTGVGISNYQISCLKNNEYRGLMVNYDCASHPHNTYIQLLSEGGLITFICFNILLIYILYLLYRGKNQKIFNYISIATMLVIFWPIMSTGSLFKNWNGVLTFYIIGICISINRIKIN